MELSHRASVRRPAASTVPTIGGELAFQISAIADEASVCVLDLPLGEFVFGVAGCDVLLAVPIIGLNSKGHQAFRLSSIVWIHGLVEELWVCFDV